MPAPRKNLRLVISIGIAGFVLACSWLWISEWGVHKFVMPGTYKVKIAAENGCSYSVWHFWQWTSKGVDDEESVVAITILDPEGTLLQPEWRPTQNQLAVVSENGHTGKEVSQYCLDKSGTYTVICREKCVIALVPVDKSFMFLDGYEIFHGIGDDFNFDAPVH
jgi:hypothetical protein